LRCGKGAPLQNRKPLLRRMLHARSAGFARFLSILDSLALKGLTAARGVAQQLCCKCEVDASRAAAPGAAHTAR
jgi:hypothetical protein